MRTLRGLGDPLPLLSDRESDVERDPSGIPSSVSSASSRSLRAVTSCNASSGRGRVAESERRNRMPSGTAGADPWPWIPIVASG